MIRALIFDFDGLILDTEQAELEGWTEIYRRHGLNLPFDLFIQTYGTTYDLFHPSHHLEYLIGHPLDHARIRADYKQIRDPLIAAQPVMPGVLTLIEHARDRGLKLAVASSSTREWVLRHLTRLNLVAVWDQVYTREDVEFVKPDPALYLRAAAGLGVTPAQAVALEDSPHGIAAAKAAGMHCIAVPTRISRHLPLHQADFIVDSLALVSLDQILARFDRSTPAALT